MPGTTIECNASMLARRRDAQHGPDKGDGVEYHRLGRSELQVSQTGLGSWPACWVEADSAVDEAIGGVVVG
jgi:hypothetical protein